MPWPAARALAAAVDALPPTQAPLVEAMRRVLARELVARSPLPAADNSAMDGWAVAGPPPWRIIADLPAGRLHRGRVGSGECVRIATGATVPAGVSHVLPVEESVLDAAGVRPAAGSRSGEHARGHIRRCGEEARPGDVLLPAGTVVTPPVLGLAAATGHDVLAVVPAPTVDLLVLGDELLRSGPPGGGRVRDALGPQLTGWLQAFEAPARTSRYLPDDVTALSSALRDSDAQVVITTGGTGAGPRDHVTHAVAMAGGEVLVGGVAVKPGHPMLLCRLPRDRWLVGLPGNPFAACAALVTLVQPLIAALGGRPAPPEGRVRLTTDEPGRPGDGHRLLPVASGTDGPATALPSCGAAMLRGLAQATGLAVVPPAGACAGDHVPYLPLPWSPGRTAAAHRPPVRGIENRSPDSDVLDLAHP